MKRYLLFLSEGYSARGGWDDFKARFDTLEDALLPIKPQTTYASRPDGEGGIEYNGEIFDSGHVVDLETFKIVARFYGGHGDTSRNHDWEIVLAQE